MEMTSPATWNVASAASSFSAVRAPCRVAEQSGQNQVKRIICAVWGSTAVRTVGLYELLRACWMSGRARNVRGFEAVCGGAVSPYCQGTFAEARRWLSCERIAAQVVDFYEFYEGLQEGWDGPALLVFSDGDRVGARLDRNGLRPARYWLTDDDLVYVASEVRNRRTAR